MRSSGARVALFALDAFVALTAVGCLLLRRRIDDGGAGADGWAGRAETLVLFESWAAEHRTRRL